MNNPKCFISYSWDSNDHRAWVRNLATELQNFGISTQLDQWDLKPGQDMTAFMEYSIRTSDFVLLICTENFAKKSNEGKGGVGYEKHIITGEIFSSTSDSIKYLPILRGKDPNRSLPSFLKSKVFIDFREDSNFQIQFEEILRTIYDTPKFPRPNLGKKPDFSKPLRILSNKEIVNAKSILFKIGKLKYSFILPKWWDRIDVDISNINFTEDYTINKHCQELYGADVGTKKTWKYALKAHALYDLKNNGLPIYIAHCASAGGESEFAIKIYTDLYNLTELLDHKKDWYQTYLAYESGGEFEVLGQYSLAIIWYKKATNHLNSNRSSIRYYAEQSMERMNYLIDNSY